MNRWLIGLLALACAGCGAGRTTVSQPTAISSVSAVSSTVFVSGPPVSIVPSRTPSASRPPTSRPATSAAPISPVSAQAKAVGLLDVRTVVPDAIV
ncbi:MAG TPA: hypothetical protein VH298_12775, partial [Jatrophihabitans sp.]|nr:hypothetical protein [Jatrophihabitans sp.]